MKEIAKAQAAGGGDGKSEKESVKDKKGKKDSAPPAKEKPKRKGPLDFLPSAVEEWAIYDAPDEVNSFNT